jgi:hypothetical protein
MTKQQSTKCILVLTNGFVFVGDWHEKTKTQPAHLTDASNVRKFGTTAGLGQLALTGPTADTALDPCGVIIPAPGAIVFRMPCNPAVWGDK